MLSPCNAGAFLSAAPAVRGLYQQGACQLLATIGGDARPVEGHLWRLQCNYCRVRIIVGTDWRVRAGRRLLPVARNGIHCGSPAKLAAC